MRTAHRRQCPARDPSCPCRRPIGEADFTIIAAGDVLPHPAAVTGVERTPIAVERRSDHRVHALVDIAGGMGTLSAPDVAARTARVVEAARVSAPQRTAAPTPWPAPVVVPRTAG